ncbi:hypothetical protein D3C86_2243410 [compost metagenome]
MWVALISDLGYNVDNFVMRYGKQLFSSINSFAHPVLNEGFVRMFLKIMAEIGRR